MRSTDSCARGARTYSQVVSRGRSRCLFGHRQGNRIESGGATQQQRERREEKRRGKKRKEKNQRLFTFECVNVDRGQGGSDERLPPRQVERVEDVIDHPSCCFGCPWDPLGFVAAAKSRQIKIFDLLPTVVPST